MAVENGDLAAVTQALQQGANAGTVAPDYDAQSISVLQLAIDREKCYITLPHPREPLPDGAYYGYYPRVRNPNIAGIVLALLKQGADPNARDQHGVLLLLHAVEGEYSPAIVQALLEHGASPSAKDNHGFSALAAASDTGNLTVVRMLLAKGARPDQTVRDGFTPLQYALRNFRGCSVSDKPTRVHYWEIVQLGFVA